MSYGDVCEAAGLKRSSAMAIGVRLARASHVPDCIHRVVRNDGTLSAGWKGPIGTSEDCIVKLKEEGVTFNKFVRRTNVIDIARRDTTEH